MIYLICLALCLITSTQAFDKDEIENFRREAFAQHNTYRGEQCAPSLTRNDSLDRDAQAYCESMAISGNFTHSGRTDCGETSYQKIPYEKTKDNGATPVIHWYQERVNYTSSDPSRALHFTQLVWKTTTMLGVGFCPVANNGFIAVALYWPRGNYENQFLQNVACGVK